MSGPSRKQLLELQRMEMALLHARLADGGVLDADDFAGLRYVLGCARLYRFVPGAALGRPHGEELAVDQEVVAALRRQVLRTLRRPLLKQDDHRARQAGCAEVMAPLFAAVREVRARLLDDGRFGAHELDAEIGRKALVVALGGGGGAGYVYIGAMARLRDVGFAPDYLVGASMGSLIGAIMARSRTQDLDGLLAWAKSLTRRQIFARPRVGTSYTLPGVMRLHLEAMRVLLQHPDGSPLRIGELEIPYEAVVAGVRAHFYSMIPESLMSVLGPGHGRRFSQRVASRMLQLTALLNPMLMKPVVLGRDADTRRIRVSDAVGLSCAIPAVLQYEPLHREAISDHILAALREREALALFADGGVVDNVPARVAWEGVHNGRIGTRNAFHLAFDCFAPQWDSPHLWLGPLQQLVQVQLPAQRPYFDWLLRFTKTLSPVNLLPRPAEFDTAWRWGWEQAEDVIPLLKLALAPVHWRAR